MKCKAHEWRNGAEGKVCTKCKIWKPLEQFHKARIRSDGLQCWCKICVAAYGAVRYPERAEERRAYSRQWRREHPERGAAYRQEHAEEIQARNAKYRRAHVEERQVYDVAYYQGHREEIRVHKAAHYQENAEEHRAASRHWRQEHPEQIRVSQATYRRENAERLRARDAAYRCKYLERVKATQAAYRQRHAEERKEAYRRWVQANPDVNRERCRRRRARKLGVTIEPVDERAVYERDNYRCVYCGTRENLTLDHIVPLLTGGKHSEDNLVIACRNCNSSKGAKSLIQWIAQRVHKNEYGG